MEAIIKKYQDYLFVFCLGYLKDKEEVKDIVQETFIRYYKQYYSKGMRENSGTKSLLSMIAYNAIMDFFRKEGVRKKYLDNAQAEPSIPDNDAQDQILGDIWEACETGQILLTQTEKNLLIILFAHVVNPKSNKEIAKVSGLDINTVANAKKTLFKEIRAYFRRKR